MTTRAIATSQSLRLREIATHAFQTRLLPVLRENFPGVADRIVVTITSSVAYGTADSYSDLDVFVIFRRHCDYRKYAPGLEKLINELELVNAYGDVCDKGVRFELESLQRSDLSGLYYHPERLSQWHRQTEWLLFWFINSVPIYDPDNIHAKLCRRAGKWPDEVLVARRQAAQSKIRRWTDFGCMQLDKHGLAFAGLRAVCRAVTAGLDLAYLTANCYGPHPKWRHPQASVLLANDHHAAAQLSVVNDLAAQFTPGVATAEQLAEVLLSYGAKLSQPRHLTDHGSDHRADLAGQAWSFTVGANTTWVIPHRDPSRDILLAAEAMTQGGDHVYLADELGADRATSSSISYDNALRIADPLRWLATRAGHTLTLPPHVILEGPSISRRRWLYVNFVIWRKLRVVDKARRRRQPFTCRWYQLQVIELLIEAMARTHGTFAPPPHLYHSVELDFLDPSIHQMLTEDCAIAKLLDDVDYFLTWGWNELDRLQRRLTRTGLIPADAIANPLATQLDIEYWKYENLFI